MSTVILLSIFWVFAATATAFLPMRYQKKIGLPLLAAAAILIVWLGVEFSWWISVAAFAAFASMFRRPLLYFWAKARGENPEIPK